MKCAEVNQSGLNYVTWLSTNPLELKQNLSIRNGITYMGQRTTIKFPHNLLDLQMEIQTSLEKEEFDLEKWTLWLESTFAEKVMTEAKYHLGPVMNYEEWKVTQGL